MTRWYWSQVGGTLIEEFPAVQRSPANGARLIDGVIIRGGEYRIANAGEVNLANQDIIVVQTKNGRLGMTLMGQAFFLSHLLIKYNLACPNRVRLIIRKKRTVSWTRFSAKSCIYGNTAKLVPMACI